MPSLQASPYPSKVQAPVSPKAPYYVSSAPIQPLFYHHPSPFDHHRAPTVALSIPPPNASPYCERDSALRPASPLSPRYSIAHPNPDQDGSQHSIHGLERVPRHSSHYQYPPFSNGLHAPRPRRVSNPTDSLFEPHHVLVEGPAPSSRGYGRQEQSLPREGPHAVFPQALFDASRNARGAEDTGARHGVVTASPRRPARARSAMAPSAHATHEDVEQDRSPQILHDHHDSDGLDAVSHSMNPSLHTITVPQSVITPVVPSQRAAITSRAEKPVTPTTSSSSLLVGWDGVHHQDEEGPNHPRHSVYHRASISSTPNIYGGIPSPALAGRRAAVDSGPSHSSRTSHIVFPDSGVFPIYPPGPPPGNTYIGQTPFSADNAREIWLNEVNEGSQRGSVSSSTTSEKREDATSLAPKKNRKVEMACHFCRGRKLKCDGEQPTCQHCAKRSQKCSWDDTVRRRGPGQKTKEAAAARVRKESLASSEKLPSPVGVPATGYRDLPANTVHGAQTSSHDQDIPVPKQVFTSSAMEADVTIKPEDIEMSVSAPNGRSVPRHNSRLSWSSVPSSSRSPPPFPRERGDSMEEDYGSNAREGPFVSRRVPTPNRYSPHLSSGSSSVSSFSRRPTNSSSSSLAGALGPTNGPYGYSPYAREYWRRHSMASSSSSWETGWYPAEPAEAPGPAHHSWSAPYRYSVPRFYPRPQYPAPVPHYAMPGYPQEYGLAGHEYQGAGQVPMYIDQSPVVYIEAPYSAGWQSADAFGEYREGRQWTAQQRLHSEYAFGDDGREPRGDGAQRDAVVDLTPLSPPDNRGESMLQSPGAVPDERTATSTSSADEALAASLIDLAQGEPRKSGSGSPVGRMATQEERWD